MLRQFALFTLWIHAVGVIEHLSAQGLSCQDFQKIVEFVSVEHLRFKDAQSQVVLTLLQESVGKLEEELKNQGYWMVAADFAKKDKAVLASKKFSNASEICEALPTGIHRAFLMKAFVAQLDPFSEFYLTEELPKRTSVIDGHFVGVGIGTESKDPFILVQEVVEDGPSDKLLKVGDLISHVDGYPVRGMDAQELRRRMRGEVGSKVVISGKRTVNEAQVDFEVTVTRNHVYQKSVTSSWAEEGILQIKIHRFFTQTAPQVKALLDQHRRSLKGIILDLRDNPGGLLQAARDVVDLFVNKGVVLHMRGTYDDQLWAFNEGGNLKTPLVILVNERSASASEIVAGALQDYGRAILVGARTYGKSCIQNIYDTESLGTQYVGGLKLTTLWYYLPSGRSVRTLKPDVALASLEGEGPVKLPYEWPDWIDVSSPASDAPRFKKILRQAAQVISKDQAPEEAGRTLVKMMAVRP